MPCGQFLSPGKTPAKQDSCHTNRVDFNAFARRKSSKIAIIF